MPKFPDLMILRHGETAWNRAGRMQGALDSPLTDVGRGHARRQGQILRDFGVDGWDWVASPQGRALATARIAATGSNADIATDPRLREIEIGDWTGAMRDEIRAERPDLFTHGDLDWYDHAPGGEGIANLTARCTAFLAEVSRPTVVVTHGITSRVLRALLTGGGWQDFRHVGGGQGVVYHLSGGIMTCLDGEGLASDDDAG